MGFVQRLVLRLAGSRAADIERETRSWMVTCPKCNHQRSYWELGGIRYQAASRGKKIGSTCPACGYRGLFPVTRSPET